MAESINQFRVAEGKKMRGPFGPFPYPVFISSNERIMEKIEDKRRKFKACENGCKVCDDCESNLECKKCVMCVKCCAAIKRKKDSLERTERNFEKWFHLWQNEKTTEPFWKFNQPKRKTTVPRKPKEEIIWDEIVKADGRPFKEREDYNSDEEFKKERKLAEDELDSNADLYEDESCLWCHPDIPNPDNRCECPPNKGMKKVRLELYEWRQLAVVRKLAKMKNEEETRKREKLELIRWQQEIRKEEVRRNKKNSIREQEAELNEPEELPCVSEESEESPCVSEDESEESPCVSEDESKESPCVSEDESEESPCVSEDESKAESEGSEEFGSDNDSD